MKHISHKFYLWCVDTNLLLNVEQCTKTAQDSRIRTEFMYFGLHVSSLFEAGR